MRDVAYGPDVKGGLQEYKTRQLDDGGLIEFEFAPVGYLTKKGEPRMKEWRAYFYTAPGGPRTRQVSVTTLLDLVTSKGGLPYWFEGGGIKGAHEAHQRGLLTIDDDFDRAVQVVRSEKLGAEAERERAADRGLNVHALLEEYMTTGTAPNPSKHPEPHRGFITGMVKWLIAADPEPVMIEELVASPGDGYAGRMDLLAKTHTIGGRALTGIDVKTQENAGIYLQAHVQLALYIRGHVFCGGEPPGRGLVVVFSQDGEYREAELAITDQAALAALEWYRFARPVEAACESENRAQKKARREVVVA